MASPFPAAGILPAPQTLLYKTVGDINIEADVYLPTTEFQKSPCPVFLFIHGGGWISGSRKDVNGPMVHELLSRGVVVTSIDYRLMPEVTLEEMFDDVRSAEKWVCHDLPSKVKELGFEIMPDNVLVGGASAGAHLAMMVPHLWQSPPLAILAVYGPTDFTTISPLKKTIKSLQALPTLTPEIVKAAIFDTPRTFTLPNPAEFLSSPRSLLGLEMFRSGGIGEFLAAGLTPEFELRKPGSLPVETIAKISPALLPLSNYPPLFHIMGTDDQIFTVDQATVFAEKLQAAGVVCETLIVTGAQHAFDSLAGLGGGVHRNVMVPAVDFVCQALKNGGEGISSRGTVTINFPDDGFTMPARET